MKLSIKTRIYSVGLLVTLIFQGCIQVSEKEIKDNNSNTLVINKEFQSDRIGNKVFVSTRIRKSDLERIHLKPKSKYESKTKSNNSQIINFGFYKKNPEAWYNIKIINTQNIAQKLILEESIHLRCDALDVYSIERGEVKELGSLVRSTPLIDRKLPFYVHAIPFTIEAKDTLDLWIRTQRVQAVHEVNLKISKFSVSLNNILNTIIFKIINLIILLSCMIIIVTLGWIYSDKKMLYLGLYIFGIFISLTCFYGFLDWFMVYPNISIGSTPIFMGILGALYQPFGIEIMKDVPKNNKLFNYVSWALFTVNILLIFAYSLPQNILYKVDYFIIISMWTVVIISIIWTVYSSIIALIRAKIYYFFIAVCVIFIPFIFSQIRVIFLHDTSSIYPKVNIYLFLLTIVSITLISVFQMQEKLITRKKHKKTLNHIKVSMETIRKNEVGSIGRNLHDSVGNILVSAIGYLNLQKPNIGISQHLIKEAINEIRFLSHNLVKNDSLPISLKLAQLSERFNEFSTIRFSYFDFTKNEINKKLSEDRQLNLYYIVQELFSNIIKHSFANEVALQIFHDKEKAWIVIEDDGLGWESNPAADEGIGLKNIYQRAKLANFSITLDSTTQGTIVIIEVTYENNLPSY